MRYFHSSQVSPHWSLNCTWIWHHKTKNMWCSKCLVYSTAVLSIPWNWVPRSEKLLYRLCKLVSKNTWALLGHKIPINKYSLVHYHKYIIFSSLYIQHHKDYSFPLFVFSWVGFNFESMAINKGNWVVPNYQCSIMQ